MRHTASFLAVLIFSTSTLSARIFTDQTGRLLDGDLIETSETTVKIKRHTDQQVFSIAIKVLSPQDQEFVAQLNSAKVEEPLTASANYRLGRFTIATADAKPQPLQLRIKYNNREVWAGSANASDSIDFPIYADTDFNEEPKKGYAKNDSIYLYVESKDYASQWHFLQKSGDTLTLKKNGAIKLHRKKYVIIEYAFYAGDAPSFAGREPTHSGVAALGHWGSLPGFKRDWQIWQGSPGSNSLWGAEPLLEFHRGTSENGMIESRGLGFDQMQNAPAAGYVHHGACGEPKLAARAGSSYYVRVVGHTQSTRGYGKIQIREITETVPAGIEIITR